MNLTIETSDNITYWLVETTSGEISKHITKNAYNKTGLIEKLNGDKDINTAEIVELEAIGVELDTLINQVTA